MGEKKTRNLLLKKWKARVGEESSSEIKKKVRGEKLVWNFRWFGKRRRRSFFFCCQKEKMEIVWKRPRTFFYKLWFLWVSREKKSLLLPCLPDTFLLPLVKFDLNSVSHFMTSQIRDFLGDDTFVTTNNKLEAWTNI